MTIVLVPHKRGEVSGLMFISINIDKYWICHRSYKKHSVCLLKLFQPMDLKTIMLKFLYRIYPWSQCKDHTFRIHS